MGLLLVHQFVSVDGFAADADGRFPFGVSTGGSTAETDLDTFDRLKSVDAVVLGATTYRMFAEYWPTGTAAEELLAPRINELPKVVVSNSIARAPWGDHPPASIVSEGAIDAIRRLKHDLHGDLIVWGSLTLTDALFERGLVDHVRLVVLPVVVGDGRRVFPPSFVGERLRHTRSATLDDGLVSLDYDVVPAGD